ncbi:MAG: hypothetical protein L3J62_11190 [Gammaproteobacteria bacterium]|nr:hypothetical protein [Gammaproteobacteria bacterium]MCF6231325.1 hypothetical protein [Gammaproteobacteria bacterium]
MKLILKRIAEVISFLLLIPILALVIMERRLLPQSHTIYTLFAQCMATIPGIIGDYLRRVFYRFAIKECGSDFTISFGSFFSHRDASVGDRVYIGAGCIVGKVAIHNDVLIASKVSIPSGRHQHPMNSSQGGGASREVCYEQLTIGQGAWIGEGAMVLASIGERSVVGSGSVLVKPISANVTVAGNPAKEISK